MTQWREVDLATLRIADAGWHRPDPTMLEKLKASLRMHGQLRAIVVFQGEVVEGRNVLQAMLALGWTTGMVVETTSPTAVALSLEIGFELNYAALAGHVAELLGDATLHDLSIISPWSSTRLNYFDKLVVFDWSQFKLEDDQQGLWEEEAPVVTVPDPEPGEEGPQTGQEVKDPEPPTKTRPSKPVRPPEPVRDVPRRPPPPTRSVPVPVSPPVHVPPVRTPPARAVEPEPNLVRALDVILGTSPPPLPDLPEEPEPQPFSPPPAPPRKSAFGATRQSPQMQEAMARLATIEAPEIPEAASRGVQVAQVEFLGGALEQRVDERNYRPSEPPQLDGITEIELDTETTGLNWRRGHLPIGIAVRLPGNRKYYLPFGHAGGNLDEAVVKRWAQRELRGKRIVGANIGFDNHMMYKWGIDLEDQGNTLGDVQHYAALLDDYRREFSLDALARDFLKRRKTGEDLDKNRMADYHAAAVADYAMTDVELTGLLKETMWPLMTDESLHEVRALEEEVIYPVCEMERNGALLDRDLLKRWVRESEQELNFLLTSVASEVGFAVNPDKTDDMLRMFNKLGVPISAFTEKGTPSFSDAVLAGVDHPLVQRVRKAGKLASLRSKFLVSYDKVVDDDCLLNFSLHQLRGDEYGTNRGRFSASNKNIQQVMDPGKQREAFGFDEHDESHDDEIYIIRQLFIAQAGYDVLSADAEQIEYRLAAHFADAQKIIQAYVDDPHADYHEVVKNMLVVIRPDMTRKRAKGLNFAMAYGAGGDKIAESLRLPRAEADKFVAAYDGMFPEVKAVLRKAARLAETTGFVRTISGRRARFPDHMKAFAYKAFNAVDQGSAADIMKKKLIELHRERKRTGFLLRMTVHDSVVGDTPGPETTRMVDEILNRQSYDIKVPILWKTKTGPHWAAC